MLYWSLQGKMAQLRMFNSIFEVKTSVFQSEWLGSMRTFNTGLQWCGQQFPCILRIVSTKCLLGSFSLYNVLEKSKLKEKVNWYRGKKGKKDLIFLHISNILTKKNVNSVLVDFWPGGGGFFKNFWEGMGRWDPGTLSLYQSYNVAQLNFATLY